MKMFLTSGWLIILILALLAGPRRPAQAQDQAAGWQAATNLSQAGASSEPRLVAVDATRWWVFWMDQFEGLKFSLNEKGTWGQPMLTTFPSREWKLEQMPSLVSNGYGTVHAFWTDKTGSLWHSQLPVHATLWQTAELLSEKVVAFQAQADPDGNVLIAFARTQHTEKFPAGVYTQRLTRIGGWEMVRPVYQTIYYRNLTDKEALLQLAVGKGSALHLIFNDPHKKETYAAYSKSGGSQWAIEPITSKAPIRYARVVLLADGSALRLWSEEGAGCALWQQTGQAGTDGKVTWGDPLAVLPGLDACPAGDRFMQVPDHGLYWVWGEGSAGLSVTQWNAAARQWSEAAALPVSFTVEGQEEPLAPGSLQLAITADRLIAAGTDADQDIWAANGAPEMITKVSQPASGASGEAQPVSPWSALEDVALESGATVREAAGVFDSENQLHVVGVQQPEDQASGPLGSGPLGSGALGSRVLVYARRNAQGWSRPVALQQAEADGLLRQPDLMVDPGGLLHLAWSGGTSGEIYYQRVASQQAGSPGAWSAVKMLSPAGRPAVGPSFGLDAYGMLYLAYALPVNEGRGVYLLRSQDGGEQWSDAQTVFNAAAENWLAVDHPDLAVGANGALFATWVRSGVAEQASEGIYYSHSADSGKTWSTPISVAGKGSDWPKLFMAQNRVEFIYSETSGGRSWQRSLDLSGDLNAWSVPSSLSAVQGDGLPVSASMDAAGRLYLLGLNSTAQTVHESLYADSRWSSAEQQPVTADRDAARLVLAVVAPGGGRLGVLLALAPVPQPAVETQTPTPEGGRARFSGLVYLERSVDVVANYQKPAAAPRPTQTVIGTPTPAVTSTPVPSPTPPLADLPLPGTQNNYQPLFVAGGLAGVVVIGAFVILLNRRSMR